MVAIRRWRMHMRMQISVANVVLPLFLLLWRLWFVLKNSIYLDIAAAKIKEGVTSFLATTLTTSEQCLTKTFAAIARYQQNTRKQTDRIPGIHLEGPFINPKFIFL